MPEPALAARLQFQPVDIEVIGDSMNLIMSRVTEAIEARLKGLEEADSSVDLTADLGK